MTDSDAPAPSRRTRRTASTAKAPAAPAPAPVETTVIKVRPMARPARFRIRHKGLILAFVIMVAGPIAAAWWYLEERAADQYASTLGFTVRSEDTASASDILGGVGAALGGGGSKDSDILYEFIRSQEIVTNIDARLDLRGLYARHTDTDPVFGFAPGGTIEDLTRYWQRMVRISYDSASGLMELRVLAFDPAEAQAIAQAIYDEGSAMINALADTARDDATRYAQEDLDLAIERLKDAREAITAFRIANEIVDPTADIQGQMGLLNTLQGQLAAALIDYDLLAGAAGGSDPRLEQAQARIDVIEARIVEEREKFGAGGGPGGTSLASTVAEFESLTVDREFAETAYLAALQAYDVARAGANRQSRYLAAYIRPTSAEASEYPQRPLLIGLVALFAFLIWAILSLVFYALRDRR
jgi:capsular polysaccharide transport system permease protein